MKLRTTLPLLIALGLLAAVVFLRYQPGGASPSDDPADLQPAQPDPPASASTQRQVDIDRLLHTVSVLAHDSMRGRAPGTPESAEVRAFLVGALREAGIAPLGAAYEIPFGLGGEETGTNIVGMIPGSADGVIVLTAHFDHVGVRDGVVYNGADDNASGTAAALEVARIVSENPLQHTLVVALLDAEEMGLQGARAFVGAETVPRDRMLLNVNLDMVARSAGTLWAAGAYHTPAFRPVLEGVAAEAPTTLRLGHDRPGAPEGDDWTSASDHGPFHAAGIPFVYFGVEDHPDYHQPTDDVERIVASDFESAVQTILMALRALDSNLPTLEPAP